MTRHLILLLLKAYGGSITGKALIYQGMDNLNRVFRLGLSFKRHAVYGVWSNEVDKALTEAIGAGFVNIRRDLYGKHKKGTYFLTESGNKIIDKYLWEKYPQISNYLQNLRREKS